MKQVSRHLSVGAAYVYGADSAVNRLYANSSSYVADQGANMSMSVRCRVSCSTLRPELV